MPIQLMELSSSFDNAVIVFVAPKSFLFCNLCYIVADHIDVSVCFTMSQAGKGSRIVLVLLRAFPGMRFGQNFNASGFPVLVPEGPVVVAPDLH